MLVLTRKIDEQICIGDDIKISVVRIRGNVVRIGIDAPREVRVMRAELVLGHDIESESKPNFKMPKNVLAAVGTHLID